MERVVTSSRSSAMTTTLVTGLAAAALVAIVTLAPQQAVAKPEFTAQTKLPCGQCHANPAGGGALKPLGQKFKDNGFKLK